MAQGIILFLCGLGGIILRVENYSRMISYNPKDWYHGIIMVGKADTLRKLIGPIVMVSIFSAIVIYIDLNVLTVMEQEKASRISVMHSLLGFVISLLLVFRTNTAYERWWEGRKLWGALLNCSRNMSIRLQALLHNHPEELTELKRLLINYPYALKNHLRNVVNDSNDELESSYHISGLAKQQHIPLHISDSIYSRLQELNKKGVINTENFIALGTDWQQLMEICGACERIKNTPIPFSYSTFIKKFLIIYIFTLPIAYGPSLGYYAVPIVAFIFYVLTSLELIAEEIENPFGIDDNDLPLDEISKNIRLSVENIIPSTTNN